jgi:sec-independent protein translocase protein TatB
VFNLSGSEIVVILLLALIVLGPEKLPEAIRRFARVYG